MPIWAARGAALGVVLARRYGLPRASYLVSLSTLLASDAWLIAGRAVCYAARAAVQHASAPRLRGGPEPESLFVN